ncbi:MAG: type IX secretion system membrane protein PorP/SprF [Bacteroidales bacterium]|nr:type IX secretion system membrane protein PorP/SprF [Bacteroidales bacterium]
MKKLIFIFVLFTNLAGFAQQDVLFSQYMFNKLLVNPGYAGSREVFSADVVYRNQWTGFEGAPKTIALSMHAPLRYDHIAVGGYIYSDKIGPQVNQGALLSYAYRVNLPKGKLSFGLQAGVKYNDINWSMIDLEDADLAYQGDQKSKVTPDANFGIYYYTNRMFAGVSSTQLLQNEYGMVTVDGKKTYSKLLRHFYGMAGIAVPISDMVVFRPSVLVKYVKDAPWQMDLNASFLLNDLFWLGMTYRTDGDLVFLTEFNVSRKYRLGYSYDVNVKDRIHYNSGSHEIRIGIDLDLLKNRMYTPRYF